MTRRSIAATVLLLVGSGPATRTTPAAVFHNSDHHITLTGTVTQPCQQNAASTPANLEAFDAAYHGARTVTLRTNRPPRESGPASSENHRYQVLLA